MKKIFAIVLMSILILSSILANDITDSENEEGILSNQTNDNKSENQTIRERIKDKVQEREEIRERIREINQTRNELKEYYQNNSECPNDCSCSGSTVKCTLPNGNREMTIHAGNSGNVIVQVKNVNMSTNVYLYRNENGTLIAKFQNNETKKILTPDQIQERIENKLKIRNITKTMNLTEEGYYEVQMQKRSRLFFIFPVKERMEVKLTAENGEIVKVRNPWWGFLARDIQEETLLGSDCGTVSPEGRDECCTNKGYNSWNSEESECVLIQ